jgi:hypothetical protein
LPIIKEKVIEAGTGKKAKRMEKKCLRVYLHTLFLLLLSLAAKNKLVGFYNQFMANRRYYFFPPHFAIRNPFFLLKLYL